MNKPNIIFLFADQLRAQALGYAGDPNVKTPYLDKLAAESINMTNAVSNCPICTPYRACSVNGAESTNPRSLYE
jgi:arylsulfatase A-like enzyme